MLSAVNTLLMLVGTWIMPARLWAGMLGCCCCCLNIACIITVAVFRFNAWGSLSTLCDGPSKYNDDGLNLSADHTVSGDAALILGLWFA